MRGSLWVLPGLSVLAALIAGAALQLSSTQFSPRLLRNFLRDRPNHGVCPRLRPRVGEHVVAGTTLAWIWRVPGVIVLWWAVVRPGP